MTVTASKHHPARGAAGAGRRLLGAVLAASALFIAAGCDADGIDDATGQPVAAAPAAATDPISQRSVAIQKLAAHEAAHIVAAQEFGWPVCEAWVDVTGEGRIVGGLILYGSVDPCGEPVDDYYKLVAFYLVGPLFSDHADGDNASVAELLDQAAAVGLDPDEVEDQGRAEAERIATERADEIDLVTADLLDNGILG
ncbi:MAG: hypothetical protein ACRDTZ_11050 [Pseudonocardiaceae bacterium]